ncbi:MAG: hypothetical protein HY313_02930 [Acidobacteria bacterium]|nr:hypothetical protein [Acidobacteriota bacterium]
MAYRQAKFCMDLDRVRWTLLEGVITRKKQDDGPLEGQEAPIQRVSGVEKITVKRVHRSPLAWPVTLFGIGLLVLSSIVLTIGWVAAILGSVVGLACLFWGVKRISPKTEVLDAHQIVIPGTNPNDWVVVGSISEVLGFIEGIKIELQEKEKQSQQTLSA